MLLNRAIQDDTFGADVDPNLQLQQQQKQATAPAGNELAPIPPPPPLPAPRTMTQAPAADTPVLKAAPGVSGTGDGITPIAGETPILNAAKPEASGTGDGFTPAGGDMPVLKSQLTNPDGSRFTPTTGDANANTLLTNAPKISPYAVLPPLPPPGGLTPATPTPEVLKAASSSGAITADDPSRPGAGYIGGKRIMGTENGHYQLDDGTGNAVDGGPINQADLDAFSKGLETSAQSNNLQFHNGVATDGNGKIAGYYKPGQNISSRDQLSQSPFDWSKDQLAYASDQANVRPMVQELNAAYASGDPTKIAAAQAKYNTAPPPAPTGPARYLIDGLEQNADGTPVQNGYNALSDTYRQQGITPGAVNQNIIDLVKKNPALVNTLPPEQAATLTRTLASMGISVPSPAARLSPGSGSDTGGPSSTPLGVGGVGPAVPLGGGAPVPGSSGKGDGTAPGAGGPYTPGSVAIGSTILPNADPRLTNLRSMLDSAAGSLGSVDRGKLSSDIYSQIADASAPQYQADLRAAKRAGWSNGQGGSSMERDLYRNTFTTRQEQLDNLKRGLVNDATSGSIADQFGKVGALSGLEGQAYGEGADTNNQLRTERGYQGSQEEQAFQRALEQYRQEQDDVANRFSRGVTLTQLGDAGNPSSYLMQLAQQYNVDPSTIAALAASSGRASVPAPPAH
jgi:hypothetical protein